MNWKKRWLNLKNKFGKLTQEDIHKYSEEKIKQMDKEEKVWMQKFKEKELNNQFRYLETANKGIKDAEGKADLFTLFNLDMYLMNKASAIVNLIDICCGFETKRHIVIHWSM